MKPTLGMSRAARQRLPPRGSQIYKNEPLLAPDRIGTDGAGPYPPAIAAARKDGLLPQDPLHYVSKHLQQGIESNHFRVKRPMPRIGGFQSFHTARRTIRGFECDPAWKIDPCRGAIGVQL
jgi:transposase-like protein